MQYTIPGSVTDMRVTPKSPYRTNTNGYGVKIPSRYMLRYGNRWYRVYVAQYGNTGTPYVIVTGHKLALDTDTLHTLESLSR